MSTDREYLKLWDLGQVAETLAFSVLIFMKITQLPSQSCDKILRTQRHVNYGNTIGIQEIINNHVVLPLPHFSRKKYSNLKLMMTDASRKPFIFRPNFFLL